MAIRTIRLNEDEILRKKCRKVEVVDDKVRSLFDDMLETMHHVGNAAGLAAPQVGILKRLVVIDMGEQLYKLVNPEIIEAKGDQEVYEGCLSLPDKWGKLNRPEYVKVTAQNENGETIVIEGKGDLAKCLCHEIDHLEGILFTDKVTEFI